MYDFDRIKKYIVYLNIELGLSVSFHMSDPGNIISLPTLHSFNFHANRFCNLIKDSEVAKKDCMRMQRRVTDKAASGDYCGCCRCGVTEFIFPIRHGDDTVGFISVSGYGTDAGRERARECAVKYGLDTDAVLEAYDGLNFDIPDRERIATLMHPLCDMLELSFDKNDRIPEEDNFAAKVATYIKLNHNQKLTSRDICKVFFCSRSYLSREFNKYKKMSINDYILKLRLSDAKLLLRSTKLTITEIAYSVGFADANYFTTVFRKKLGVSPKKYRETEEKTTQERT